MLELSAKHSGSIHLTEIGVAIVGVEVMLKRKVIFTF